MISTSGSGQMLPLPMNEFIQQTMKQCGFDITFEVVEWGAMLVAFRNPPTAQQALGSEAINISLVSSDVSRMSAWFLGSNFPPNGANWGQLEERGVRRRPARASSGRPTPRRSRSRRAARTSSSSTTRRGSGSSTTATRAR